VLAAFRYAELLFVCFPFTAFYRVDELRNAVSFRSWIFQIAHNKCIDLLRARKQNSWLESDAVAEIAEESQMDRFTDNRQRDPNATSQHATAARSFALGAGHRTEASEAARQLAKHRKLQRLWINAMIFPSLSLNQAAFAPPPVAMSFSVVMPDAS
jgi:hypothetical protein